MTRNRLAKKTLLTALSVALLATATTAQYVDYTDGPLEGRLGNVATIRVPRGYGFVDQAGMPDMNAATGNLHNPQDVGALFPLSEDEGWIVFFAYDPIGYVPDDDRDELDADEMIAAFKDGDRYANEERRRQGMPELHTVGWSKPPYYDTNTHNLTWGLKLRNDEGELLNHQVRVLGRRGVMEVILVAEPRELAAATTKLDELLEDFSFVAGETYAEYTAGDKVAEYGLAGLVLGGGLLAAAKSGLLAKLGKFMKPLILAVIAFGAGIGRFARGLFDRSGKAEKNYVA